MTAVSEREFRDTLNALHLNPECGEWDSIRHFNLVMELEARWHATIPIEDVEKLETFSDFYFRIPCRPAKVIAVDADNTLWKGIISEDGAEAVEPYMEFQSGLKALRAKGALLVLLSKNDPPAEGKSPVEKAFKRKDLPLSVEDFSFIGVNWEPKAGNLLAAARALNVGTDSFVFVDDNPHERAQMKSHLPEVMVLDDMEAWIGKGMRGLADELSSSFFADTGKTEEDLLRAQRPVMILPPEGLGNEFSKADYLKNLKLNAIPSPAVEADIPRLAQMAGKTNQFNSTAIRRTEDDFRNLLADASKRVFSFRLSDKFGAMGIVCYIVLDITSRRITDFVMSCRAMGRTLEFFALRHVCTVLGIEPDAIEIDFRPTEKNAPFAAFLERVAAGDIVTYCSSMA